MSSYQDIASSGLFFFDSNEHSESISITFTTLTVQYPFPGLTEIISRNSHREMENQPKQHRKSIY